MLLPPPPLQLLSPPLLMLQYPDFPRAREAQANHVLRCFVACMTWFFSQDILIKKGIVEKDDVLRGKGIDPDEQRLEEAIVS